MKIDWKILIFAVVVLLEIGLRLYNFSDWLFFKMDQARDANVIKKALLNGPGSLPLLGPKVGGTQLNVGPAFYYFQYVAAAIFRSDHPAVMTIPDLIFSILSIFVFYQLLKKYFSRDLSMIISGLYGVSFLAVEYGRFAWNPNSLPFFNFLFLLSFMNMVDKSRKYRLRWAIIAGASFAVSTQLHFLSFFTLPTIVGGYVISDIKNVKSSLYWRYSVFFILTVLILFLPVFLNEFITKGENLSQLIKAVKEKPSHHSLIQNVIREVRYFGQYWLTALTGYISSKREIKSSFVAWIIFIIPGIFFLIKNLFMEKEQQKRQFLLLIAWWFLSYYITYLPVAYQIRPRFILPILGIPFIFLGFMIKSLIEKRNKLRIGAAVFLVVLILIFNLVNIFLWFHEMVRAQKEPVYPKRTIILKSQDGVTLWHFEQAADYILKSCPGNKVMYTLSNAEHKSPLRYTLERKGLKVYPISSYRGEKDACIYSFSLARSLNNNSIKKKGFEPVFQRQFGAIVVKRLSLKDREIHQPSSGDSEEPSNRKYWNDVFDY